MSVVANVAINLDSRGVPAKLKQVADRSKELEKAAQGASTAVTKTGRELKTAANGMQYFIDATGRARKANGQFVTTTEAAAAGLDNQGRSAQRAAGNFNGLIGTVGKLAAAYLTLNAAQSAVSAGIQRIESERRIQFLAKQYGEVDQLARAAANASDRFGQSQTTANKAVADIYARLRPVGVSLENIVSVYNGFNTAARISGATALEAESAFRQLSQALGSGALQGDEFRSISEQVPGILTAISQETGVAQSKLKKYAAEGKITADVVIAALQRIERDGADQLKEALGGPEQAIRDFQNAAEDVQVALTTAIVPEMARAFRDLAAIIEGLEPSLRFIGGLIADTLGSFRTLVESIRGGPVVERLRQGGQLGFNVGQEKEQLRSFFGKERFAQLEQQARESAKAQSIPFAEALGERLRVAIKVQDRAKQIQARPKPPGLPARPVRIGDTVGGGGGGAGTKAAANVMETDAQRAAKIQEIRAIERDIFEARRAGNEVLVAQLEALKTQIEIKQRGLGVEEQTQLLLQNGERLNERLKELDDQRLERLSRFLQGTTELIQAQNDVIGNYQEETRLLELRAQKGEEFVQKFKDVNRLMMEGGLSFNQAFSQVEARTAAMASLNQEADLFQQALQGAGDIIGNQLRGAIDGLIDGTADWNNILRDTLSQLGSFFLNLGLNQLAGPAGSGGILSFLGFGRASGGPVMPGNTYMVGERGPELLTMTPSGGYVTSNSASQAAMDRYSSGNTRGGSISVNYNVTEINGMKFVTEDQFRAGISQAAKQGAEGGFNRTMTSLKNSRSTRSRVGV